MADGHWVSNWYLNATGRSAQEYQGAINLGNFKRAIDFHGSMTASQMNYYLNGGTDPNVRCTPEGCVGAEVDVGGIGPGIPLPTIPPEMITAAVNGFWDVAKAWLQAKYPALRHAPNLPRRLVRVIPDNIPPIPPTMGLPWEPDVFATTPEAIAGITTAAGLEQRLTLEPSRYGYNVYEFPTPEGIAVPINRGNWGYVNGGFTAGGAPEYVIPNGPFPSGTTVRHIP